MVPGWEKVEVAAEFSLHCADDSSMERLEAPVLLGPLDHTTQNFTPITVLFVYRREEPASGEELIPIERFRRALGRLLDYYPHLTGRIVMHEDNAPRIERLGAGATLVSAKCRGRLEAFEAVGGGDEVGSKPRLIVTNLSDGGNALLPPFDPSEEGKTRDPILAVQHTRFACGGVAIGICLRHIICDASGFFQLVRDLAALYRGFRDLDEGKLADKNSVKLSKPPHIHSYRADLHEMTPEKRQEALESQPAGFRLSGKSATATAAVDRVVPPPVIGRVLRFSSSELAALKAEANASNKGKPLSTFCALAAHLWKSIYRARVREARSLTSIEAAVHAPPQILLSVDLRSRNQLADMLPRYFPNAVFSPVLSVPAAQVLEAPLSVVAALIRDGTQPQEPAEMLKALQWIAAQPDKRRVQPRYNYEQDGVFVTQWSKFDMYRGSVFDVPPALVAQPFTPLSLYDGLVYLMATEDQLRQSVSCSGITTGSIDVSMALSESVWTALDQDADFRHHR
ncbi:hypothetical protein PHYPSEUDO_011538 [Phytophthora pseudosyringae]|uniref:Uncharacterized protein n=1 Tax=Phytophthora pseudosyringae TaxID=221518 RepID=A0A8T1V868_9STRA|nr:hypothetical protein PHYPSEUDO_011538 [Phytophthora pseudosyringae]